MPHSASRYPFTRRRFLTAAALACGQVAAPALIGRAFAAGPAWRADPFSLGVAAGAPLADGFVLWTRLAPDPLSVDPAMPGGMAGGDLTVSYEIAGDPQMRDVVRRGTAVAEAAFAHAVHADVRGLEPGCPYWYRFACGDAVSRIGCARTTLPAGMALDRMRFGFVSCSHYEYGYFSAYRHLADENPDLVVFLGDYIYEYVERNRPTVRTHSDGVEAATLPTYRNRYAQYRLDPDLQRLHAQAAALITWDDHEVQNDYADRWSQDYDDPAQFLLRRAAAYQAFYEHMPVRPILSRPNGPLMRIYDRFTYGDLVEFSLLDGRQYRSREACYGPPPKSGGHLETDAGCPELADPGRSLLGFGQESWLAAGLDASRAHWNILAQDVLMAPLREKQPSGAVASWTDNWDGYPAARRRLLRRLDRKPVSNPVVISGDIHSFWANDLHRDPDDAESPIVASELVGTSVTSPGPSYEQFKSFLPDNPHVHYFESRVRGYVSVDLDREKLTARMRKVSDVTDAAADVETLRTFTVESGRPGIQG